MNKKIVLITGASSGIGEAYAHVFAKNGYNLLITARNAEKLNALATLLRDKYTCDVWVMPGDLSQHDFANAIFTYCTANHIDIEILVNNAGFADFAEFYKADWNKIREMIDLNIMALTHMTHLFLPLMVARKSGKVLNIASTAAFLAGPLMSVYYASKAYVLSFSEAIANEVKGTGITVTVQCPGPVSTNFQAKAEMLDSKLFKNKMAMPMTPEAVAEFGFKALMEGKTLAIQGFMNKMTPLIARLLPRSVIPAMVRMIQENEKH